jgi:cytochrome c-type biogenesis protein CcmH/NrfG
MKRRLEIEIHREDHKYDALGQIFLGAIDRAETLTILREYLGTKVTLHRVELDDDRLRIQAEVKEFATESRNLVELAREMMRRGHVKGAVGQLEEALQLAPLSADALKTLGRLYYRQREPDLARQYLTRAREVSARDLDILRLLAEIALHQDQRLTALAYLEQVLRTHPSDRRARAALARLQPASESGGQSS